MPGYLKVLFAVIFIILVMGVRWSPAPMAQPAVYGVPKNSCTCFDGTRYWNAPCGDCPGAPTVPDDEEDVYGEETDTSSDYGGCATTAGYAGDEADADTSPAYAVGDAHPDHPNIRWTGTGWRPIPGQDWLSSDPNDLRVVPVAGYRHPNYPNVIQNADGTWRAADGYRWINDDPGSLATEPIPGYPHPDHPNTIQNADGTWRATDGHRWANDDPDSLQTEPIPGYPHPDYANVVQKANGNWRAADGYRWVNDDPNSLETEPIPGYPHPKHPHVVQGADGKWYPEPGYRWAGAEPDWTVELMAGLTRTHTGSLAPAPGYVILPEDQTRLRPTLVAPDLQRDSWVSQRLKSLQIIDVPTPVLFTASELSSYAQTEAIVASLGKHELERRIERLEYVLGALRTTTALRSAEFEDIRAAAAEAENAALIASFKLLVQGFLPLARKAGGDGTLSRELRHWSARGSELMLIFNTTSLAEATVEERLAFEDALKKARNIIASSMAVYGAQVHGYYAKPEAGSNALAAPKSAAQLAALAFWAKDYLNAALEWKMAYDMHQRLTDSSTAPEALIAYQRNVSELYEVLITERNKRTAQ